MADERWGRPRWPGLKSIKSCTYTLSHGSSPGTAIIRANPQAQAFASEGTLTLLDGVGTIALKGMKVDRITETRGSAGVELEVCLLDRRWKWRDAYFVNVTANQLDPHGKFIPSFVRSPVELAQLCLNQMGETGYSIDLPVGLTSGDAAGLKDFLPTGVNFPPTGVNPPVEWYYEKPMQVLEQLAEMFGRRIVWDWKADVVRIVRKGVGGPLPGGSVASRSPSINLPEVPDGVMVVGAPTRFQVDLEVQAVGQEFDGTFKPINALSYAPVKAAVKHKVSVAGEYKADFMYYVFVNDVQFGGGSTAGQTSMGAVAFAIAAAINASTDPKIQGVVTAALGGGDEVEITAVVAGPQFDCGLRTSYTAGVDPRPADPPWTKKVVAVGATGRKSWANSPPPLFPGVRATPELTLSAARDLARKSVWRFYQLTGRDISGRGPINIPGWGTIKRKQQIVLLDTQCEQVVPAPADFNIRYKDDSPIVENLYNGFSRDKPAAVYGAVAKLCSAELRFVLNRVGGNNTLDGDRVNVDFSTDPVYQMIKFGSPVWFFGPNSTYLEPSLRLRTAVNVRDPNTNGFVPYQTTRYFAGKQGKALVVEKHDDVQANTIPTYNAAGIATAVRLLESDPVLRAGYYLDGMEARYRVDPALTNVYNGLMEIGLDGAISQITWECGDKGCKTTASLNHEHATNIPPYPARRRAEGLRAAVAPGGFLGQLAGRTDPSRPPPSQRG